VCKRDQSIYSVPLETIIYFRHIDDKVLAHCRDVSHECKLMLHVIEKELENMQFVRISKSSILNLKFLERVKPLANGRYEAYLKNGEKLIINRKYVLEVKKKMGIF
jgi:DNA-binding LytR/AlgR family response regulator